MSGILDSRSYSAVATLTSSSEGCDRDGLFAAILFTAAAMVRYKAAAMRIKNYEIEKVEDGVDEEFRGLAIVRL